MSTRFDRLLRGEITPHEYMAELRAAAQRATLLLTPTTQEAGTLPDVPDMPDLSLDDEREDHIDNGQVQVEPGQLVHETLELDCADCLPIEPRSDA